jgi:predicted alpha/beta superfamily hydrolase
MGMRRGLSAALLLLVLSGAYAGLVAERLQNREAESNFLNAPRTVRVYLPPSYDREPARRYPVLYLHDGQNLFSPAGTNICFGWGNWELDKTVDDLCRAQKMEEIIMVGIDNSPARYAEYCGRHRSGETNACTEFENYAAFLIRELKPTIDSGYRTRPEPANTGIMGSSLGGTCSSVVAWEHPDVFGRAASLSGAFQVEGTNFLNHVLRPYPGKVKPTRLYLDSGVVDFTGGDDGQRLTAAVVDELRRIGWEKELMHYVDTRPLSPAELEKTGLRQDKWKEAQASQHNEFYWRLRVWHALVFLFPPAPLTNSAPFLEPLTKRGRD